MLRLNTAIACAFTLATAAALPAQAPLTSTQARADFDILRNAIVEAHGGLTRFSTKAELDRRFDGYRARLDAPIGRRAFIGLVSEMVAEVRDGHARVEYDDATTAALTNARLMPLRVQLEGPKLVVVSNDSPNDTTMRPGMEVTSINGHPVSEIVATILPKIAGDGFIETGKRTRLGRVFAPLYWLFVDSSDVFTISARQPSGAIVTTKLAGVLSADRDKMANPVNAAMRAATAQLDGASANIALTFPAEGVARLRIRGFDGQLFTSELDAAFKAVDDRKAKTLILDLRGNGGGVDEYGANLVSRFVTAPFRYFDRIHLATIAPSFATWKPSTFDQMKAGTVVDPAGGYLVTSTLHSGVGIQQPAAAPFTGTLLVLMDGGTFSTSADVTATLHNMKRATFIGEESAGGYEGNTSGLNALIVLPNSGLKFKVQMYGYWNAVAPPAKGRGTPADYLVERHVSDVLNGVDVALERALTLARTTNAP